MKINESSLISFATAHDSPVDKEGWLWKKGEVNKAFQKRYFVLKGNLLFYFEKRTDREPVGVIILEGCIIELAEEDQERFGFKISFHGERTRVYHLGTEYQQTLVEWMRMLACASHDYLKLMVFELQQKLNELDNVERRQKMPQSKSANAISNHRRPGGEVKQSYSAHSLRRNPFNEAAEASAPTGMDGLYGGANGVLVDVEEATEVLSPGETVNPSSWTTYHSQYGQKILADYRKWLRDYASECKLVDVDGA